MSWPHSDTGLLYGFLLFLVLGALVFAYFQRDRKIAGQTATDDTTGTLSDLRRPIEYLLKSGVHGASLTVTFPDTEFRVLFQKEIWQRHDYGIVLHLEDSGSSGNRLDALRDHCQRNKIPFAVAGRRSETSPATIRVDCGRNIDKAYGLLRTIVTEIAGLAEDSGYDYEMSGGSRPGELVDSPDQQPCTEEELSAFEKKAFGHRFGYSYSEVQEFFAFTLALCLGYAGLLYSIIIELGVRIFSLEVTWAVLHFEFFGLELQAKAFDLLSLGLILTGSLMILTRPFWRSYFRPTGKDWSHLAERDWHPNREAVLYALRRRLKVRANILIVLVLLSWLKI